MHLKTISLVGFKSFADRTRIECEPGVTVVVGPNGTGKSNIVDGLAWVMGTQATSALRTSRMEDVIFAGTSVRPALGRAEVSLTLESPGGELEGEVAEVTVGRRLFRDGTSEYEVNGIACRLLDVQELLADAGVGRHQHVIVGQGRVDAVLNAGPEEHRAVIEEAAGVVKHRSRRDRAIRRLESSDGDVVRLRDLLAEQQKRMKPLRRQARAAERHDGLKAEWRNLRLWVGGEELRVARGTLGDIEKEQASLQHLIDDAVGRRKAIDLALPSLTAAAGEAGAALDRDTAAAARLETSAERLHRIALVARERRSSIQGRLENAAARRRDLVAERTDLERGLETAASEEASAREAARRLEATVAALEDEERSLADQVSLPAEGVAAALRGDIAALQSSVRRDEGETADLERRMQAVAALITEEDEQADRLRLAVQAADAALSEAIPRSEALQERAVSDRRACDTAVEVLAAAEVGVAATEARLAALEAAEEAGGDALAWERAMAAPGAEGSLVAALDVPVSAIAAAAAALGQWEPGIVVADGDAALVAAEALGASGLGGVAFVARGSGEEVPARGAAAGSALVDLLGPAADRSLAAGLLGDVVVADTIPRGMEIALEHPGLRVVTERGDLVSTGGVVVAAGSREELVAAAGESVDEAKRVAARAASLSNAARRDAVVAEDAGRAAAGLVASLEARRDGLQQALAVLERSAGERRSELSLIEARLAAATESQSARIERLADLRARLEMVDAGAGDLEALERRRDEVAGRREDARRRLEQATGLAAGSAERRTLLRRRLEEVDGRLVERRAPENPGLVERLEAIEGSARRAQSAVRSHIASLRDRQRSLRDEAGEAGARLEEAREGRDRLGSQIESARERLSEITVTAAELAVRIESTGEALRRDADAEEEEASAAPRPEIPEGIPPAEHLDTLAARLRRLGPINPLAAAEYKELEERAEFLESQLDDLEESRRELRKVISALDEEIVRLFTDAFEDVARLFAENVSLLFPGGTSRLALTDPDDALASGVDIHVQPMGKKVSRLALLSGGERSLAALAFLFAVFRARPSPFYVLDEVEAALDDANLRRFLRLVGTMRDTSQLVIVTHQQQTMEAADVLYGVTMEPGESSRVLAKRLAPAV